MGRSSDRPTLARIGSCLLACGAVLLLGSCGTTHPGRLADGSTPATAPPAVLRQLTHPVVTRTRVLTLRDADAAGFAACRRMSRATRIAKDAEIIERTAREGASFTSRAGSSMLFACDLEPAPKGGEPRPCAIAVGKVSAGRLLDPRLTLRCGFGKRRPLAFAWITPLPRTRWVVVRTTSADEVYATAAGLPVRVATTEAVSAEDASATIEVKELAADGKLLTQETERVVVAG